MKAKVLAVELPITSRPYKRKIVRLAYLYFFQLVFTFKTPGHAYNLVTRIYPCSHTSNQAHKEMCNNEL